MPTSKNRKLNRLTGYDYCQDGWYFITICAKNREHFFGKIINDKMRLSPIGAVTQKCWQEIPKHFPNVNLDEFIIMPNHIHGIINIVGNNAGNNNYCSLQRRNNNHGGEQKCREQIFLFPTAAVWQTKWARSVSSVVRGFKIGVTKWCRQNNYQYFVWQKSFYDHIIRNEKSLNKIREYIINNPLKWDLDRNNI
jgi:REP element-mobilizing transposase RayT